MGRTQHAWKGREIHTKCWLANMNNRNHLEDLSTDGKTILKWNLREIRWQGVDWIHLAPDTDQ